MNKIYTDVNLNILQKLLAYPEHKPVHMINYLKYKEVDESSGKTGREVYREYMEKATPFFQRINAKITFKGAPSLMVIGPEDEDLWDEILIVTYATKRDFLSLIEMEGYPGHLRKRALKDSRLVFCK
ncbi:hypothetical protein [Spongiimicrobium salis]|uniref:hypothetical protein n=1 Tax=Spongiimicrobium salis TaxID=1667022 RepID=UPI00374D6652